MRLNRSLMHHCSAAAPQAATSAPASARAAAESSTCPGATTQSMARPTAMGTYSVPATFAADKMSASTSCQPLPRSSARTRRSVPLEADFFIAPPPF